MVLVKYLEFTLAAAFAVLTYSVWLLPLHPPLELDTGSSSAATAVQPMIVVVVSGKRMTSDEKRLSTTSH